MPKAYILFLDGLHKEMERLHKLLVSNGYSASHARNLHEIFQLAKVNRPDVIVVGDDVNKHDAFKVCEELRSESDTCYANIVLLVPVVDERVRESARVAGVNDVVEKNIDAQKLLKRIEALLGAA